MSVPVVTERSLVGSNGMLEIGEPPVIPPRFTLIHPVPAIDEAAVLVSLCVALATILPNVPVTSVISSPSGVPSGTLNQIVSAPLPFLHNVLVPPSNTGLAVEVT